MSQWLEEVLAGRGGFEQDVVRRYSERLIAIARHQLPERLRGRVDPEDVVQSVFSSFFRRISEGRFRFEESHDLWRLLAAMTFHKSRTLVKYHQRRRRDVRRDVHVEDEAAIEPDGAPGPEDLAIMVDCLRNLLDRVPANYREIVVLRLEGLSIAEIAARIERSQRTVLRALARLHEIAVNQLETAM